MELVHLAILSLLLSFYLNYAILLFNKDTSNLAALRDTPIQAVINCWTHWMEDKVQSFWVGYAHACVLG